VSDKQATASNATASESTGVEEFGYRAPQVCNLVGITYRQLDYWARTGLLEPSLRQASGSGSQRLYSFTDVVQLKVIKQLLDAGMSLKKIRSAVEILKEQLASDKPLTDVTLLSDGRTIYAATSADEVMDVLRRGQGVFGIAVGPVQDEVAGAIHELFPEERQPAEPAVPSAQAGAN